MGNLDSAEIFVASLVGAVLGALTLVFQMRKKFASAEDKSSQNRITTICAVVGALAAVGISSQILHLFRPNANEQIVKMCDAVNKQCPVQVDEVTRLVKCTAGNMRVTYSYVLTNVSTGTLSPENCKNLQATVSAGVKANPDTKRLLDLGITLAYQYSDETGKSFLEFDVTPSSP